MARACVGKQRKKIAEEGVEVEFNPGSYEEIREKMIGVNRGRFCV